MTTNDPNAYNTYESAVYHEVWCEGGRTDDIDYDRVSNAFDAGIDASEAAEHELAAQGIYTFDDVLEDELDDPVVIDPTDQALLDAPTTTQETER